MRNMLTREIAAKDRKGRGIKKRVGLSQQDIADWLGCSVFNIQSIETGRVRLTEENAEILQLKTGCSAAWLLGTETTNPVSFYGAPFSRRVSERAQSLGFPPTGGPSRLQLALKETLPLLANVLLHALDCDDLCLYKTKTRRALETILGQMPQKPRTDLRRLVDFSSTDEKTPDWGPLFQELKRQALKICERNMKAWYTAQGITELPVPPAKRPTKPHRGA